MFLIFVYFIYLFESIFEALIFHRIGLCECRGWQIWNVAGRPTGWELLSRGWCCCLETEFLRSQGNFCCVLKAFQLMGKGLPDYLG